MQHDLRSDLEPLIEELLATVDAAAPGAAAALPVQQAASRLIFEAFRRGQRRAHRSRSSAESVAALPRAAEPEPEG